jgi:hypothetical protein
MTIPEQQAQNQTSTNDKEFNFGQLRKQVEQERSARMQLEAQVESMKSQMNPNNSKTEDDFDDDAPYVDKKTLDRVLERRLAEIDKRIESKSEEKARRMVEIERQNSYLEQNSDFNQILQPDMIQKYAEKYPQKAKALLKMPDNFDRQVLLYEDIKAHGLHKPPEPPKPSIQDTINKNRRSPYYQPSASAGAPPYESVGDFTQAGQKNAYQKMQELINNRKSF